MMKYYLITLKGGIFLEMEAETDILAMEMVGDKGYSIGDIETVMEIPPHLSIILQKEDKE